MSEILQSQPWKAASGGRYYNQGHVSIGSDAVVNGTGPFNSLLQALVGTGTYNSPLMVQEQMSGTPANWNVGQTIKVSGDFNATAQLLTGTENTVISKSTSTNNFTFLTGLYNTVVHYGSGVVSSMYGAPNLLIMYGTGSVTTASAVYTQIQVAQGTITNGHNLYVAAPTNAGTLTNIYGLYIEPITQGTNNYGIAVGAASTNTLWLAHTTDPTTAAGGITFGTSKDTNLYRSAADTLKTDDNLIVAAAGTAANSVATIDATQTLTNKRVTPRTGNTTSSATPTINTDTTDVYEITAQAADITSFTTNLSGTPTRGQKLWISITDDGTARAITWGSSFEASGTVALPTTTVTSTRLDVGFVWNTATSKWRCVGVA